MKGLLKFIHATKTNNKAISAMKSSSRNGLRLGLGLRFLSVPAHALKTTGDNLQAKAIRKQDTGNFKELMNSTENAGNHLPETMGKVENLTMLLKENVKKIDFDENLVLEKLLPLDLYPPKNQMQEPGPVEASPLLVNETVHNNGMEGLEHVSGKHSELIKGDLVLYNNLLNFYAEKNNYEKSIELFGKMKKVFALDMVSYSSLIKVAVKNNDIYSAFKLYEEMKSKGLFPNQLVFTNLIQGCINNNQMERAWAVFNHLKSEIEKPDAICYSLMISACARTRDAEKALDLLNEMNDYHIDPTTTTFNNLIRACGLRQDYYLEAFNMLQKMIFAGLEPNIYTYRALTEITASQGDLEKARLVWNDFACRMNPHVLALSSNELEQTDDTLLKPDTIVFSHILRMYRKVLDKKPEIVAGNLGQEKLIPDLKQEDDIPDLTKFHFDPQQSSTSQVSITPQNIESDLYNDQETALPLLNSKEFDPKQLEYESDKVWDLVLQFNKSGHIKMTGELWMRRLDILALDKSEQGIQKTLDFFNACQKDFASIEPTMKAYKIILKQICTSKHFKEYGSSFWARFLEWDNQHEAKMVQSVSQPLSIDQKEEYRLQTNRTRRAIQESYFMMAYGYLDAGDLNGAITILQESVQFRQPYYLPPIHLKSIYRILDAAQKQADMGILDPLKTLRDLCPPLHEDPLHMVQKVLAQKTVPSKWWGWQAIGVDEKEKEALMRRHQKANSKIMQREMGLRRKAQFSQENKAKKPLVFRGFMDK